MTHPLAPGTRVRLRSPSALLRLDRPPTGTIIREDDWPGYYIIGLDAPVTYRGRDGQVLILEITEAEDNIDILTPPAAKPS